MRPNAKIIPLKYLTDFAPVRVPAVVKNVWKLFGKFRSEEPIGKPPSSAGGREAKLLVYFLHSPADG
jgi:hypothetical protein